MPTDVRTFFDGYRDAFNRLAGRAVSARYDIPAMIAYAGASGIFQNVEALDANNIALCAQYATDGFLRADFEERAFMPQSEDFCVADLAWRITRKDKTPQCFNTSYALAKRQGVWKVYCVTAYAERRQWADSE